MICLKLICKEMQPHKLIVTSIVDNGLPRTTYQHQESSVCYTLVIAPKILHYQLNYQSEQQEDLMDILIFMR